MMRWGLEGEVEEVLMKYSPEERSEVGRALAAKVAAEARRKSRRLREKILEGMGVLG